MGVTPGPSQCVFAQGDGGGPLLRAELLVSSCVDQSIISNSVSEDHIDMTDTGQGRWTRKLAGGSGWIRVNLDLGSLQPLGNKDKEEEFEFDISDTLVESDSNGENVESENVTSNNYYNKISGSITNRNLNRVGNSDIVSPNNLERAVLMPSQEESPVYFSPSQEKEGEREEQDEQAIQELEVGMGTILSLLCLSAVLFLANCLPCALHDRRRKTTEEVRRLEAGTKEDEKQKEVDRKQEEWEETEGEDQLEQGQEKRRKGLKEVEILC